MEAETNEAMSQIELQGLRVTKNVRKPKDSTLKTLIKPSHSLTCQKDAENVEEKSGKPMIPGFSCKRKQFGDLNIRNRNRN